MKRYLKIQIAITSIFFFVLVLLTKDTAYKVWQASLDGAKYVNINRLKKLSPAIEHFIRFYNNVDDLPVIYIITPTYARETQIADLTSLRNTVTLVPRILWIIVEDSNNLTTKITNFLEQTGLAYVQLSSPTPFYNSSGIKDMRIRGVIQRNSALRWLKDNGKTLPPGVVYFADDDNRYDIRVFEEMRYTKKVSTWPVGLVAQMYYERPICRNGKVVGFFSWIKRPFAIDMAGFAINLHYMLSFPDIKFLPTKGKLETNFLTQLITLDDLEPKADNCTKIYVWHTKTAPPQKLLEQKILKYRYNMSYEPKIVDNV